MNQHKVGSTALACLAKMQIISKSEIRETPLNCGHLENIFVYYSYGFSSARQIVMAYVIVVTPVT